MNFFKKRISDNRVTAFTLFQETDRRGRYGLAETLVESACATAQQLILQQEVYRNIKAGHIKSVAGHFLHFMANHF